MNTPVTNCFWTNHRYNLLLLSAAIDALADSSQSGETVLSVLGFYNWNMTWWGSGEHCHLTASSGFEPTGRLGALLCGVRMFFSCLRGFSPGTPASSHNPKTCPWVWVVVCLCIWALWLTGNRFRVYPVQHLRNPVKDKRYRWWMDDKDLYFFWLCGQLMSSYHRWWTKAMKLESYG